MTEGWINVYTADQEYQGALIAELLKNHDLHPVVLDKKDDEFLIGYVEVYVAPEEAEAARKIIEENKASGE